MGQAPYDGQHGHGITGRLILLKSPHLGLIILQLKSRQAILHPIRLELEQMSGIKQRNMIIYISLTNVAVPQLVS